MRRVGLMAGLLAGLAACDNPPAPQPARAVAVEPPAPSRQPAARCGGLHCRFIHRMMRPDQAPPLHRPRALPARRVRQLRADHRVLGVWLGEAARAYPLNLLAYHRVVNDELAGRPVMVAHSPLSGTSLCAATAEQFRHSGAVYEGDDLLTDDRTGDLWSVAQGRSIRGRRSGTGLERISCAVMTWAAWRALRPRTSVASPRRAPRGFDYTLDPWAWYRKDDRHLVAPVHFVDLRLPYKQVVLGLTDAGRRASAFPLPAGHRVINTDRAVVVLDGSSGFAGAYTRALEDGRTLSFAARRVRGELRLVDRETGSGWNLLGEATDGPLRGRRLRPTGTRAFFFAWAALYPGSEIQAQRLTRNARRDGAARRNGG